MSYRYQLTELTPTELAQRILSRINGPDRSAGELIEKVLTDFSNEHEHRATETRIQYLTELVELSKRNIELRDKLSEYEKENK